MFLELFIIFCLCTSCYSNQFSFDQYINIYEKQYNGSTDYHFRYQTYKENIEHSKELNFSRTHDCSAYYGETKFSDLLPEEFKNNYLSDFQEIAGNAIPYWSSTIPPDIPKKIDWRRSNSSKLRNVISEINDQKSCGACWAFSSVETIESMRALKTGKLSKLSVQEMIDCSKGFENLGGCSGGGTCLAFKWMLQNEIKLEREKEYPTKDKDAKCRINASKVTGVGISNYTCVNYATAEMSMLELLTHGPVTVGVDATSWQNYQGGIIQYHCEGTLNHAVQIVGYDLTGDVPYYIVRNSWGKDFGHSGYLYIKYGDNMCGIAKIVSTVTV